MEEKEGKLPASSGAPSKDPEEGLTAAGRADPYKPYRIAMICSTLQAVAQIPMWVYDVDGRLLITTGTGMETASELFSEGGSLAWAREAERPSEIPLIMSDRLGFMWLGEWIESVPDVGRVLLVLGPMFSSDAAQGILTARVAASGLSARLGLAARRIIPKVPVIPMPLAYQYARMIHHAVTERTISSADFVFQVQRSSRTIEERQNDIKEADTSGKHYLDYEEEYARERILMQNLREGNLNYERHLRDLSLRSLPERFHLGDPLREAKDIVLIFLSKCSAAAIEGGLSPKTSRMIQAEAVGRIEACRTILELSELNHQIYEQYVLHIRERRSEARLSKPVREVCDYIKAHFMEEIRLEDLARETAYTEYYLARKFSREMGVKITDYIRDIRLDYARIWLMTTEKSIREISEELQFCSRNYFSRVFRAREGMSPKEFRERSRVLSSN